MKTSICLATVAAVALIGASKTDAQIFSDTFDSYVNGSLAGQGPWAQVGTTATNPIQVNNGVVTIGPTGQDVGANFSAAKTDGTSIYSGFDITLTSGSAGGDYFFSLLSGTGQFDRLYAVTSGSGFVLGLQSSTGDTISYGSGILSLNTTYRIVLSWNFIAGAKNDTFNLYVSPTDLTTEANNTPYMTYTWGANGANEPTNITGVLLRQGSGGPTLNFDNLLIDSTFAGAAIPEPSTYAMMGLGAALLVGIQRFRRKS
jgi:hypothetical protein